MLVPVGGVKVIRHTPPVFQVCIAWGEADPFTKTQNPRQAGVELCKRHRKGEEVRVQAGTGKAVSLGTETA